MISDLDRSLGTRYFLNVANERTCFASCASAFKSSAGVDHLFGIHF